MGTLAETGIATLAEALASGPLPLAVALSCAKDIAFSVSMLHRQGLVCGAIDPAAIRLGPAGAELPIPSALYRSATPAGDIYDFGTLLFAMLTGAKPPADIAVADNPDEEAGANSVRTAALRLALRCCGRSAPEVPTMRKIAMELRLLSLMIDRPSGDTATTVEVGPSKADPFCEPHPTGVMCPWCSAPHIHLSDRHGLVEALLFWAGPVRRCHRCQRRYLTVFGCHINRP